MYPSAFGRWERNNVFFILLAIIEKNKKEEENREQWLGGSLCGAQIP